MRKTAFEILRKVLMERQYANLLLKAYDHPNINMITQIVYGTLQNYRYCRYQWEPFIKDSLKPEIEILLSMSVYQHLFLDKTPDYAIVDEANELSKQLYKGAYRKLVNAVLRRTFSSPKRAIEGDFNQQMAIEHSFDDWLINLWDKQYGRDLMVDFASSSNETPAIYVKENPLIQVEVDQSDFEPCDVKGCYKVNRFFFESEAFKQGKFFVQDKNAQVVSQFVDAKPGDVILDACAAPGGKSLSMAIKMHNQGKIYALDIYPHKIKLIQDKVKVTQLDSIIALQHDASLAYEIFDDESLDGILVDAPCSGLGVLKRKPEIKHFITPQALDDLVELQRSILKGVALSLKVGGWLVYSTCTMNKKENEYQAKWFLENFNQFEQVDERFLNPKKTCADGFYMVKFMRVR